MQSEATETPVRSGPAQPVTHHPGHIVRAAAILFGLLAAAGCTSRQERIDEIATASGFPRVLVQGDPYRHVVYLNEKGSGTQRSLRVYIEGDGTPYLSRYVVAPDPTPRQPVMLRLMGQDPAPSVYVGRPCYFGLAEDPPCKAVDWTLGRFSDEVVKSMAAIIRTLAGEAGAGEITLIGHSGGGALVVLLARRMPEVTSIITLAGLLDTKTWAKLHAYSPLRYSLNPVDGGALPSSVLQRHFAGANDDNVPPEIIEEAAKRLGAGAVRVLPDVSHSKGWEQHWPAIIAGQ